MKSEDRLKEIDDQADNYQINGRSIHDGKTITFDHQVEWLLGEVKRLRAGLEKIEDHDRFWKQIARKALDGDES